MKCFYLKKESKHKCGINKKLLLIIFMFNWKSSWMYILVLVVILINLFAAYYYYNHVTGQIDEARTLYEKAYGTEANFNAIFWLCQKIFTGGH